MYKKGNSLEAIRACSLQALSWLRDLHINPVFRLKVKNESHFVLSTLDVRRD
jgi:hypothetical protein